MYISHGNTVFTGVHISMHTHTHTHTHSPVSTGSGSNFEGGVSVVAASVDGLVGVVAVTGGLVDGPGGRSQYYMHAKCIECVPFEH